MVDYTSLLLKRNTTIEPWIFPSMLLFSCSSGRWFDYIAKYMVVFTWHDDVAGLVVVWRMACWVELGYKSNLVLLLNQTVPVFMHLTVIRFLGPLIHFFDGESDCNLSASHTEWLQTVCQSPFFMIKIIPLYMPNAIIQSLFFFFLKFNQYWDYLFVNKMYAYFRHKTENTRI